LSTAQKSPPSRVKTLPALLGFVALGAIPLWLALSGLLPPLRAIAGHAPLVALSPRDAIGLPLALLCFALAAMTQLGTSTIGPTRRRMRPARFSPLSLCLGIAIAAALLTVVAIPLAEVAANVVMAQRQYRPCPATAEERHAPMRWSRADAQCS